MPWTQSLTLLILLALAVTDGCIPSRCYKDRDCPDGELCELSTGACVVPDCVDDSDCPAGTVCKAHLCAEGCAGDLDCGVAKVCVSGHCVLETSSGSGCICVASPLFCAPDIHPDSQTFQSEVCIGDTAPTAKLLFFGNAG